MNHAAYIKKCITLAKKGCGAVSPNPMVGAIITNKHGDIVSTGYHKRYGKDHAEVDAIKKLKNIREAHTIYVNLEPCSHTGKTPPCVDAIHAAGIKRVVFGCFDPCSPGGVNALKKEGVEVIGPIEEEQCKELNRHFFYAKKHKMPYVTLKIAASLDGKIATKTGDSKWITNEKSRAFVQSLRKSHDAILVGAQTVRADNPHLGYKKNKKYDPLRVILGKNIPQNSQVFRDKNVIVYEKSTIRHILEDLYKKGIQSVLVEGGAQTWTSFIEAGYVQELYYFIAPVLIGGENAKNVLNLKDITKMAEAKRLTIKEICHFDDDILMRAKI